MSPPRTKWYSRPEVLTYLAIVVQATLHLCLAPGNELSPDESHYALFGLKPDWCYVDHPPLVGWLQAVALSVSDSELSLRFFAILEFVLVQVFLSRLCRTLFPDESPWIGFVAVLLVNSSIIYQALSFGLLPESLLMLFGILVAITLFDCAKTNRLRDWVLLGVFMGLAGLSKFTSVLLVLTAIMYFGSEQPWNLLFTPGLWIAVSIAAILVTPVFIWNWEHDWLSFSFRAHDVFRDQAWDLGRFIEGQKLQLVAYGPAIWFGGYASLFLVIYRGLRTSSERILAFISLPVFVVCGEAAGFRVPLAHWTSLGWLATIPLTAQLVCREWKRGWMRLICGILAMYALITVVAIHLIAFVPAIRFNDYQYPVYVGLFHGWKEPSRIAVELQRELSAKHSEEVTPIFVHNWSLGAQAAWYARPIPVQVLDSNYDQFDLWFGAPTQGVSGILIAPRYMGAKPIESQIQSTLSRFKRTRHLKTYSSMFAGGVVNTFDFYECEELRE